MQLMRISTAPKPPTASSDVRLGDNSAIISISMMTTYPRPGFRWRNGKQLVPSWRIDDIREERQCQGLVTWQTRRRFPNGNYRNKW